VRKLLVVLQNPWRKGRLRRGYSPGAWRREFESSRSGIRLRAAMPIGGRWAVHYCNASPRLAQDADGVFQPHLPHLRRALRRVQPDLVLACGALAGQACAAEWRGALVCVPHPAYRLVTTALYEGARQLVESWGVFADNPGWRAKPWGEALADMVRAEAPRLVLRQLRGHYDVVMLAGGE
jgi:hypothetical protein